MRLHLKIRHNPTGYIAKDTRENWEFNKYWWVSGNAKCDCNRELFFLRAIGAPEPEETLCGVGEYSVNLSDADTGEVLYSEFDTTVLILNADN